MSDTFDWSLIPSIIEEFGFKFISEPDMYWYRYHLMNPENGFRLEYKFDHIVIYHLDEDGEVFNGELQEPFQFLLDQPDDLRIILKSLIIQ